MKKTLLLILAIAIMALKAISQETKDNSLPQQIELELRQENNQPSFHRAPNRINIEAFYNPESHAININYDGEDSGEVFLYLNEDVFGYDTNINTSFSILMVSGIYRIEIYGEGWMAQGEIKI